MALEYAADFVLSYYFNFIPSLICPKKFIGSFEIIIALSILLLSLVSKFAPKGDNPLVPK
jgi:hypothetical protein